MSSLTQRCGFLKICCHQPYYIVADATLCSHICRLKQGRLGSPNVQLRPIRTPSLISAVAALTTSSVRKFSVPNSSLGPQRPHAESQGSPLFKGSSENAGRVGIEVTARNGCVNGRRTPEVMIVLSDWHVFPLANESHRRRTSEIRGELLWKRYFFDFTLVELY